MTTIAAIVKDGIVAVAADGLCSGSGTVLDRRHPKIQTLAAGGVVATSGDVRTENLLESLPAGLGREPDPTAPLRGLREAMDRDGYARGHDRDMGSRCYGWGSFVVMQDFSGVWCAWRVYGDFATVPMRERLPLATGSGEDFALGAMDAALRLRPEIPAAELVQLAVRVAIGRDTNSGGDTMVAVRGGGQDYGPAWIDE